MDVSIIIVNYNTKDLTLQCINSVYEKTQGISFEVILVDNASTDGSKEYFQEDNRITYIYSDENLGFGRANNLGLSVASGRNILFLNPDTILVNNAVRLLSTFLDNNSNVGACGGNLFDESMKPSLSFRRIRPSIIWEFNNLFGEIPERIVFGTNRLFNNTKNPIIVKYITGADLMVKRITLNQVGGFCPDFFMYYEETDLCCRIIKNKWKILSIPDAKIQHLEGKSFKNTHSFVNKTKLTYIFNSRNIYYSRNHSKIHHKIANVIYVVYLYCRMFYLTVKGNSRWKNYKTLIEIKNNSNFF